jgi:glycosyltransferase involved in cell wall biosynthesis
MPLTSAASAKPKILMILIEPPLPFGNAASRWFHVLIQGLEKRGYTLDILVASGVAADIEKARKTFAGRRGFFIYPFGRFRGVIGKLKTQLFPHAAMFDCAFTEKLRELNPDSYDIVHVEQTWAGWAALPWRHKALINVHHLQSIDLEFIKHTSLKSLLIYKSWFRAERKILSAFPFVRTCSPRLEPYVRGWGKKKIVETVPVALDLSLYPFIASEKRQSAEPVVTVIGNMTWYPSVSAAERLLSRLWPEILKEVPKARLRVVGWSARAALAKYLESPRVEVFENVPDIQPFFNEASVMVYAPSRGSGMKIKILESLAYGVPVVTTSEGAEGLPAQDMIHLGLADDDRGLIERTVRVLKNPRLQEEMRSAGRALLADHCGEDRTVEAIEALYRRILETR